MHYKKKEPIRLIEAFQYTDYDSVPEELKYSSSNIHGLMEVNLPGKTCERCGSYASAHVTYFIDGYQKLICPGTFIVYKNGVILDVIDYNTFKDTFEEVNVQEVDYNGEDETKTSNG